MSIYTFKKEKGGARLIFQEMKQSFIQKVVIFFKKNV